MTYGGGHQESPPPGAAAEHEKAERKTRRNFIVFKPGSRRLSLGEEAEGFIAASKLTFFVDLMGGLQSVTTSRFAVQQSL